MPWKLRFQSWEAVQNLEGADSSFSVSSGRWLFAGTTLPRHTKCTDWAFFFPVTRTWQCDGRQPTSWWKWWSAWGQARSWAVSRMSPIVFCPLRHSLSWMDRQRLGTVEILELGVDEPNRQGLLLWWILLDDSDNDGINIQFCQSGSISWPTQIMIELIFHSLSLGILLEWPK